MRFKFDIELIGDGATAEDAWRDALEQFEAETADGTLPGFEVIE